VHFTPTSASRLNRVERFVCEISEKRLCRGVCTSVQELVMAIGEYVDGHNKRMTSEADKVHDCFKNGNR
jgi:hypothetical protein